MQPLTEPQGNSSSRELYEMEMARQNALVQAHNAYLKRSMATTILVSLVVIGVTVVLSTILK
jgi:hypothetical protein